jgi:hypothetical protein
MVGMVVCYGGSQQDKMKEFFTLKYVYSVLTLHSVDVIECGGT